MGQIELKGVNKSFGTVDIIHNVDLMVEDGTSSSSSDRQAAASQRCSA